VTKFVVYRNPYRGTGQAPFEVRDGLIDGTTIERCLTRREAESVAHALNTKSRKQTVEDEGALEAEGPRMSLTCEGGTKSLS
jgi:hypothetical protein